MRHAFPSLDEKDGYKTHANAIKAAEKIIAEMGDQYEMVRVLIVATKHGRFMPVAVGSHDVSYLALDVHHYSKGKIGVIS